MVGSSLQKFPLYGSIGFVLISFGWVLNWSLDDLRTHWGFFVLWLGYCLTVDALVYYRRGTSLLHRNYKLYILLFLISMPCWWLFELFNHFTQNWYYDGKEYFTDFHYFLLASLSFSTVMPAVFGTAELAGTFKCIQKTKHWKKYNPGNKHLLFIFLTGITIVFLIIILPGYFYPFIWLSLYFILEPLNKWLGNNTLLSHTANGDWRPVVSLAAGTFICGFLWEMWNYYSYPKWIYNLPGLNIIHIFEMPAIGYLGYIPFSFELFALYNFITGFFTKVEKPEYVNL